MFAAFAGLSMQLAVGWAQEAVAQDVASRRCANEMKDFVATIDLLMSSQSPNVEHRTDFLREKVPTGKCDVEVVRESARHSKYFLYSRKGETSESFRFASETLVATFWIDLRIMEIPGDSPVIHVKKTEGDFQ
ncbi:hypothetical protein ATY81_23225 [Rhizobium sp. R72]|uniref:hypothetical protein n=1 Tax=unclassified Rhizobium TaxID=2613769 RepID=UPI000B533830|nr:MULTISPECIES: hypothetical protein [unclassified Rhizobium]OWW01867.1 hypothetical protein ATY81_23225 [Rhizobium sp. R72]OWW01970.1 hypothetical protein ATY80_23225 [Rhizobium sp. R711]